MNKARTENPWAADQTAIPQNGALGILCLLFNLLFGDPFARLFSELEALFAAWRAGTLVPIPPRAQPAPCAAAGATPKRRDAGHRLCARHPRALGVAPRRAGARVPASYASASYSSVVTSDAARPGHAPPCEERPPRA